MSRFTRVGRGRRSGVTTVEYALMLFFFVMTCIFGIPKLSDTVQRFATRGGDSIEDAAHAH